MSTILYSIKDASPDATIEVSVDHNKFAALTKVPRFREVFCPLNVVHASQDAYYITFTEEKSVSRPQFKAKIYLQSVYEEPMAIKVLDVALLRSPVLEILQLKAVMDLSIAKTLPIDVLPHSRELEIFAARAPDVLAWLAHHESHERVGCLEAVILNKVPLMNISPHSSMVRDIVTEAATAEQRLGAYQRFVDLRTFLRARHDAGCPIELVLRGGGYEDAVVRELRPFVSEVVVEDDPANAVQPRHSSRLAAKTRS